MERILTAIIAPLVLREDYEIDFSRIYIAGHSDGGQVASMVMMSKPEQFRGGIYLGAAEAWGDEPPPKLDLIRENRHAFLIGANDEDIKEMQRSEGFGALLGAIIGPLVLGALSATAAVTTVIDCASTGRGRTSPLLRHRV